MIKDFSVNNLNLNKFEYKLIIYMKIHIYQFSTLNLVLDKPFVEIKKIYRLN